jgi:hypothetical protein
MNMQQPIAVELAEQMLAVRRRLDHPCPVQECRRFSKTTLWAADRYDPVGKSLREVESEPVQRVPFRHDPSSELGHLARVTLPLRSLTQWVKLL